MFVFAFKFLGVATRLCNNASVGNIPKHSRVPFFDRLWFAETVKVVASVAAIGFAIRVAIVDGKSIQLWAGIIGAALLCLNAVVSVRAAVKKDSRNSSPTRELQACASMVYGIILARAGLGDAEASKRLRVVIHRVDRDRDVFEQATRYIGYVGGEPGRSFPLSSGVVGRCVETKATAAFSWGGTNISDLIAELQLWGYSVAHAEQMVKLQRSWLATPIFSADGKDVIGAIYADAIDPGFFTDEVKIAIADAASGIRLHLHRE